MNKSFNSQIVSMLEQIDNDTHHKQMGEFIRHNREIQGISQITLAKTSEVSRQCISKVENAQFTSIFKIWRSLSKILSGLKITVDELITYMDSKQSPSNVD